MFTKNKRLIGIVLAAALVLLIPLIAMLFTDEVDWTLFNFVAMGALLLSTGSIYKIVVKKATKIERRIAICGALLAAFFLIWADLAVGIFEAPFGGS